jgi:hypothetical protein
VGRGRRDGCDIYSGWTFGMDGYTLEEQGGWRVHGFLRRYHTIPRRYDTTSTSISLFGMHAHLFYILYSSFVSFRMCVWMCAYSSLGWPCLHRPPRRLRCKHWIRSAESLGGRDVAGWQIGWLRVSVVPTRTSNAAPVMLGFLMSTIGPA